MQFGRRDIKNKDSINEITRAIKEPKIGKVIYDPCVF